MGQAFQTVTGSHKLCGLKLMVQDQAGPTMIIYKCHLTLALVLGDLT